MQRVGGRRRGERGRDLLGAITMTFQHKPLRDYTDYFVGCSHWTDWSLPTNQIAGRKRWTNQRAALL